jgi:hypothetical protein
VHRPLKIKSIALTLASVHESENSVGPICGINASHRLGADGLGIQCLGLRETSRMVDIGISVATIIALATFLVVIVSTRPA